MSAITFQIPEKGFMKKVNDFHGVFTFKPLEKGYGVTIGNALRRVLLSSLEGYAITSVKFSGVKHEFSTIPGVIEDITEIILNLKQIRFKSITKKVENKILILVNNQKVFTAGNIAKATSAFEVLQPDFVVCNLDKTANFEVELTVEKGKGYVPAEDNKSADQALDVIVIDGIFTPIKNVKYEVKNTRVEQRIDYEQLVMHIETDGSIHPESALKNAADILVKHFALFANDTMVLESSKARQTVLVDDEALRISKLLKSSISDFGLSVRAFNCLKAANIKTLADVVKLEISDMAKFRNFGKKSLVELEQLVVDQKLTFGMDISKYKLDT